MEYDLGRAPVKPTEPAPGDCCGEGCRVCVWDVYNELLDQYEQNMQLDGIKTTIHNCKTCNKCLNPYYA